MYHFEWFFRRSRLSFFAICIQVARLNIKKSISKIKFRMLIHQERKLKWSPPGCNNFKVHLRSICCKKKYILIFKVSAVKRNSVEIWNLSRRKLEILIQMTRRSCPDAGQWSRQHLPPCTDNLLEQWNNSIHLSPRPQFWSIAASRRLKNMKILQSVGSLYL